MSDPLQRVREGGWHVFELGRQGDPLAVSRDGAGPITAAYTVPEDWYAVLTGKRSGITVCDVDNKNGKSGTDALQALIDKHRGDFPNTYTVATPNGGVHLYFAYEPVVKGATNEIAPGVDCRNDGDVVFGPGTVRDDADAQGEYRVVRDLPVAAMPAWLIDHIQKRNAPDRSTELSGSAAHHGDEARHTEEPAEESWDGEGTGSAWGRAVFEQEIAQLARVEHGSRNASLLKAAQNIFEVVKGGHLDKEAAKRVLLRVARGLDDNPDDPFTDEEIKKTLESAWKRVGPRTPEQDKRGSRETPQSSREAPTLMTLAELDDIPPPRWLIPSVLPEGLTVLYGAEGSGKTFQAIDWTMTLAQRGHQVVYCAGEGAAGLRLRTRAWQVKHGDVPSANWRPAVFSAFPRLNQPGEAEWFARGIRQAGAEPDIVVVDTLSQTLRQASDSDDAAVREVYSAFHQWAEEFGASGLIVHHTKKPSDHNPNPGYRGSGVIQMDVDMAWKATKSSLGEGKLHNKKAKEWEKQPSLSWRLVEVAGSCVVEPSAQDLL